VGGGRGGGRRVSRRGGKTPRGQEWKWKKKGEIKKKKKKKKKNI